MNLEMEVNLFGYDLFKVRIEVKETPRSPTSWRGC